MTDKKEMIRKYARTEEDELFLARFLDKRDQADKGYLVSTHFMDPHQRSLAKKILNGQKTTALFDGAYEMAERVLCLFLPHYMSHLLTDAFEFRDELRKNREYPIRLLQVNSKQSAFNKPLTHRDYLGALMNLGIKRETLGDILVHPGFTQIVVLEEMATYLRQNLFKVANISVDVVEIEPTALAIPQAEAKMMQATVASLRLDAVVAEGFNLSRSEAAEQIESGKVYLNFEECTSVSEHVEEGCIISLRGMGRMVLEMVGGASKKNRTFITIKRLV